MAVVNNTPLQDYFDKWIKTTDGWLAQWRKPWGTTYQVAYPEDGGVIIVDTDPETGKRVYYDASKQAYIPSLPPGITATPATALGLPAGIIARGAASNTNATPTPIPPEARMKIEQFAAAGGQSQPPASGITTGLPGAGQGQAGGGQAMIGQAPGNTSDVFDLETAYRKMMGLATDNMNPFMRYLANQGDTWGNIYNLGQMARSAGGETGQGTFEEWMGAQNPRTNNPGFAARGLFEQLLGMKEADKRSIFDPTYSDGSKQGSGNIGALRDLLSTAMRGRYGNVASRWFAGRLPNEQQLWADELAAGGQNNGGAAFLDWFNKKYNLGRMIGV